MRYVGVTMISSCVCHSNILSLLYYLGHYNFILDNLDIIFFVIFYYLGHYIIILWYHYIILCHYDIILLPYTIILLSADQMWAILIINVNTNIH